MPKLTKRFVDALKPVTTDTLFRDTDLKGFALRAKPSGVRTWVVQYRNKAGRTRKLALGKVGVLTPEQARQQAKDALAEASKGADPSADRHAERADLTVAELVERYLTDAPADKPTKKASSWAIDTSNLRRHVVPVLGRKSLSSLTTADVQRFQRDVTEGKTKADAKGAKKRGRVRVRGGSGTAWRATVVLAGMLAWAVGRGMRADCQRRSKNASAGRSKSASRLMAGRPPAGGLPASSFIPRVGCRGWWRHGRRAGGACSA